MSDPSAMDTSSPATATPGHASNKALVEEFAKWRDGDDDVAVNNLDKRSKIKLVKTEQDADDGGKTSIFFEIGGSQHFTLHCPLLYPDYPTDEENFFVEASESGLQLWCNALNEYILDYTGGRPSLSTILNKGVGLYSSADQAAADPSRSDDEEPVPSCSGARSKTTATSSSAAAASSASDCSMDSDNYVDAEENLSANEDGMDDDAYEEDDAQADDEQLENILDDDLSWELEIARRKKRWRKKEEELRLERQQQAQASRRPKDASIKISPEKTNDGAENDKSLQQLYHDPRIKNRRPKQVFTSAAASGILTNDLVSIMSSTHVAGIDADTIDDNIFQWNVKLKDFSAGGNLDADFKELQSRFGYDYIELQLDFSMDLYPFFPPLVKVIRPRLQGSMMLRVTTMEILKLSYWNPAKSMKAVLDDIKTFLQTFARLDLASERNDRSRYAEGAYIDIEHHLLRLALVSEMVPRANKKYMTGSPPPKQNLPPSAMESTLIGSKDRSPRVKGMHSTASHDISPLMNISGSIVAAQAAQAKDLMFLMKGKKKDGKNQQQQKSSEGQEEKLKEGGKDASKEGDASESATTAKTDSATNSSEKKIALKKSSFSFFLGGGSKSSSGATGAEASGSTSASSGSGGASGSNVQFHLPASTLLALNPFASKKDDDSDSNGGSGSGSGKSHRLGQAAKNMAKGVGYSSYQQKGWDVKAYMAAQKEKDKQIELVLEKIYQELKKLHGSHQTSQRNLPDVITDGGAVGANATSEARKGSRRKREHSPDEVAGAAAAGNSEEESSDANIGLSTVDPLSDLYAVLEGSALVPFLESKLQANSFLEICSHTSVYKCVVNIIREIVSQPCLVSLLGPLPEQQSSLHSLLLSLERQAVVLLDKIGKASANGSVPKGQYGPKGGASMTSTTSPEKATSDDKLARDFLNISKEVTKALKATGYLPDINGELGVSGNKSANGSEQNDEMDSAATASKSGSASPEPMKEASAAVANDSEATTKLTSAMAELYKSHMRGLQFDSSDISVSGPQSHFFHATFVKAGTPSSQMIFRIAQELSSLSDSLPLDFSSAIFVRSDDDRATLLRACITGPEDTPYTGGVYQFDIYFPPKYPHQAPMVNFRTTGNGVVRFNPNLYHCGKVCLSLLGTWEGAQGEQWNETSTILQVLISIQSLILCAEPYYNEPGFERMYGTTAGDAESHKYSEDVFKNNLKHAVLGQLSNPPEGFEDVVKSHFYLKRWVLLKEMEKMLEKYKSKEVKKQFAEVKKELMKLTAPENLVAPPGLSPDALAAIRDGDAVNAVDLSTKTSAS